MRWLFGGASDDGTTSSSCSDSHYIGRQMRIGSRLVLMERVLAEGGFAIIFVVSAVENGERMALKRIIVPEERVSLVKNEINIMKATTGHPRIVKYYESCFVVTQRGPVEFWILMELCRSNIIPHMNARLSKGLTRNEILSIFTDICEAVAHLHQRDAPIAHRDIKVENVLCDNSGRFKLCDFGSATMNHFTPQSSTDIYRHDEEIKANTTTAYRAPEQVDLWRKEYVSEKVDVWALGCLLYKLCYFVDAFEEETLAIANCRYSLPPSKTVYRHDDDLVSFIRFMLEPNPANRPTIFMVAQRAFELYGKPCPVMCSNPQRDMNVSEKKISIRNPPAPLPVQSHSSAASQTKPMGRGSNLQQAVEPVHLSVVASARRDRRAGRLGHFRNASETIQAPMNASDVSASFQNPFNDSSEVDFSTVVNPEVVVFSDNSNPFDVMGNFEDSIIDSSSSLFSSSAFTRPYSSRSEGASPLHQRSDNRMSAMFNPSQEHLNPFDDMGNFARCFETSNRDSFLSRSEGASPAPSSTFVEDSKDAPTVTSAASNSSSGQKQQNCKLLDPVDLKKSVSSALGTSSTPPSARLIRRIILELWRSLIEKPLGMRAFSASFFRLLLKQPVADNVFSCLKFAHLLLCLLTEGPTQFLNHCSDYKKLITGLKTTWVNRRNQAPALITSVVTYLDMIIVKIDCHVAVAVNAGSFNIDDIIYPDHCFDPCPVDIVKYDSLFSSRGIKHLILLHSITCRLGNELVVALTGNPLLNAILIPVIQQIHSVFMLAAFVAGRVTEVKGALSLKCIEHSLNTMVTSSSALYSLIRKNSASIASLIDIPVMPNTFPPSEHAPPTILIKYARRMKQRYPALAEKFPLDIRLKGVLAALPPPPCLTTSLATLPGSRIDSEESSDSDA